MSEEFNPKPETVLEPSNELDQAPALPDTQVESEKAAQPKSDKTPMWRLLIAPAWFLLGVLAGLGIFAAYTQYTAKPPIPPLSAAEVKQASRDGFMEALQEMQAQSGGGGSQGPQAVDPNAFAIRDANVLGNRDAKVSIVEFADFQCPFCGRHHEMVFPSIVQDYVDTGKATYAYKHLAFLGPESVYAAIAAECAADQGKFWEFHNFLFEHQQGENQGAFTNDKLIAFGKELNLDMAAFEPCVTNGATVSRVQADTEEAQKLHVGSTPTFFINGKPLVGLKSPDEFKAAIEQALAE